MRAWAAPLVLLCASCGGRTCGAPQRVAVPAEAAAPATDDTGSESDGATAEARLAACAKAERAETPVYDRALLSQAEPGPGDQVLASKGDGGPTWLFRQGQLVRRLPAPASWIVGTAWIRVERGCGIDVVRADTGELVFAAPLVEVVTPRTNGLAVVHTDRSGVQHLEVFDGTPPRRRLSMALAPQDRIEPGPAGQDLAWVGDDLLWLRGAHASLLVDVAAGALAPLPTDMLASERDWGVVAPAFDAAHARMVLHYRNDGEDNDLTTTLVDWSSRHVVRRSSHGPAASEYEGTVFDGSGAAFAIFNGACEALLFQTADLGLQRFPVQCGGEEGVTRLVDLRFWPRDDTLAIHEDLAFTVHEVHGGRALLEVRIPFSDGSGRFVPADTTRAEAFEIDDCSPSASKRSRIDRALRVTTGRGRCISPESTARDAQRTLAALSKRLCAEDGGADGLPREVCAPLRAP